MLNNTLEIWIDIPKFETRYQVSNKGRIVSLQNNHGTPQRRLKSTRVSSKGYEYVQLFIKDVHFSVSVHSAVAKAFIPNPELKKTVNHIDGNKLNNNLENLEWATYSENHKHAFKTGLKVPSYNTLGKKSGITSNFRNVTYDPTRERWIASVKHNKKCTVKRFPIKKYGIDAEKLAAIAVNEILDDLGLTDRPKNII